MSPVKMMKQIKYYFITIFLIAFISGNSQSFLSSIRQCKKELMNAGRGELKLMDSCYIGKKFPDIDFTTVDKENIHSADLRGNVVVLNLWSTSCGPCIAEIPGLNDLVKLYKNKNVVFISLLHEREEAYRKFIGKGNNFAFKVVPGSRNIYYNKLDLIGFPRTLIVDKKGVIRYIFSGGENSKKAPEIIKQKLISPIDKLLLE